MIKFVALALSLLIAAPAMASDIPATVEEVCFTPGGDCTGAIVRQIAQAKREVHLVPRGSTLATAGAADAHGK